MILLSLHKWPNPHYKAGPDQHTSDVKLQIFAGTTDLATIGRLRQANVQVAVRKRGWHDTCRALGFGSNAHNLFPKRQFFVN
jgi:hypothetical protein